MPDHLQDPPKFSPRSVSRLDEEDEGQANWDHTLRPTTLDPSSARLTSHSRHSSNEKLSQPPPSLSSPRIHGSQSRGAIGGVVERVERVVDPRSTTYGHHRQTSIVHGIQHSRNGSLASSISSPLSPQLIAAAGVGLDRPEMQSVAARLEADAVYASRAPSAMSGTTANSGSFAMERAASASDAPTFGTTQRRMERRQSKSRRGHSHQHSHSSRHHKDEQKTVGEYALHVLFTSVSNQLRKVMRVANSI